jgi:hypothetical protein
MWIFSLISVIGLIGMFSRCGRSGFAAVVPIYNAVVLCDLAGVGSGAVVVIATASLAPTELAYNQSGFGLITLLAAALDVGGLIAWIYVLNAISKRSGHGVGMTVLLVLGIGFYFVTPGRRRRRDAWDEPDDRLNDDQHDDFDLPIAERIRRERTNRADARASVKKALERRKRWRTADSSLPPPASGEDERHLSEDERKRRDEIRLRLARRARLRARDA